MYRSLIASFVCTVGLLLTSCEEDPNANLPGYSGQPGEVIVVISDKLWVGQAGETIKAVLAKPQFGLPQNEPIFELVTVPPSSFGKLFRTYRNVLIVNISPDVEKAGIEVKKNSWARGQVVIKVSSEDVTGFTSLMLNNEERIVAYYASKEIERLIARNRKTGEPAIARQIKENHAIGLVLQKDAYIATDKKHFAWLRIERERPVGGYQHQISQGLLIYDYPYVDKGQLTPENLLAMKDSINKEYVPGPNEGAYMSTSYRLVEPQATEMQFNGVFGVEIRGLWRMENGFMGGPFVSLTTIDEVRNRVVTIEGYVYAPQFGKREYIREMEAMIRSLSFLPDPIH